MSSKCSPDCPGWGVFNDTNEIQRCESCARFDSDEEAVSHVLKLEWLDSLRGLNETVKAALGGLPPLLRILEEKAKENGSDKSHYLFTRAKDYLSELEEAQRVSKSDSLRLEFARILSALEQSVTNKQINHLISTLGIEVTRLRSRFMLAKTLVRNSAEGITEEEKILASEGNKRD